MSLLKFCEMCFRRPTEVGTLLISSCRHMACRRCFTSSTTNCPVCQREARIIELNDATMPEQLKEYFDEDDQLTKSCKVAQFQMEKMDKFIAAKIHVLAEYEEKKKTMKKLKEHADALKKAILEESEMIRKKSLMKWKGATLTSDEDESSAGASPSAQHQSMEGSSPSLTGSSFPTGSTPDAESSLAATLGTTTGSTTTPTTERELLEQLTTGSNGGLDGDGNKIFTVELNKGWNSRLGFSLKQDPDSKRPTISAIYSESVAAKDGRLRVGDQLLTVNDESVETMATGQVIDLLRIIRGSICLRLVRIAAHPTSEVILEEHDGDNHSEQQQQQQLEETTGNADQIEEGSVQE